MNRMLFPPLMAMLLVLSACQRFYFQEGGDRRWIEGAGVAYTPVDNPSGMIRMQALDAAEDEARAQIRRQFDIIEARPGVTIIEAMEARPYVWSRIMGLLASTRAWQQEVEPDGTVRVRLRLDYDQVRDIALYGEEAE